MVEARKYFNIGYLKSLIGLTRRFNDKRAGNSFKYMETKRLG